jgi:hypothetical protein
VQVKNKCERSLPVRPPGVENRSRLRSRDPVANGVRWQERQDEDMDNFLVEPQNQGRAGTTWKVEPGLRGNQGQDEDMDNFLVES